MKTIILLLFVTLTASGQYREFKPMEICSKNRFEQVQKRRAIESVIVQTAIFATAEYFLRTQNETGYKITTHYVFPAATAVSVVYVLSPEKFRRRRR